MSEQCSIPICITSLNSSNHGIVAKHNFSVGEIVWAKIRGHSHWPAKVLSFISNGRAEVLWFNDYRSTKLYCSQLYKFMPNFEIFSMKFDVTVGLKAAAKEAMICYSKDMGQKMNF